MNLVLIGYRGTGKSTVGKLLARRLGWEYVSTDAEIVQRAGCSIPDLVHRLGWDGFRDCETEVCRDLVGKDRMVIDTGGGIILRAENVAQLKQHGTLIWLTAGIPTIIERIRGNQDRPSLTGTKSVADEVAEVLAERRPKYEAAADLVVETDQRSVEEVANVILAQVPDR